MKKTRGVAPFYLSSGRRNEQMFELFKILGWCFYQPYFLDTINISLTGTQNSHAFLLLYLYHPFLHYPCAGLYTRLAEDGWREKGWALSLTGGLSKVDLLWIIMMRVSLSG